MKKKNLVCFGLSAAMALSLAGCGSAASSAGTASGAASAASSDATSAVSSAAATSSATSSVTASSGKVDTSNAEITLRLGHVVADGTPLDLGDDYFAEKVAEYSDGRIAVEVYPDSALGDNRSMLESLQMGTIDMMSPAVAAVGGFTDSTLIFDLPYLFKNTDHAEAVLDGDIGDGVFKDLEDSGFHGLSWFFQGWRELSCNTEVHSPDDLKGMKIRTQDNEIQIASWNNLGASAVPMAFSEVLTSLQEGVIDAEENPMSNIYLSGFYEAQKYIIMTNHIYDPCPLLISSKVWDTLSDEDKDILQKAADEATDYQRDITEQMDADFAKKIEDSGKCTVVELTDEERQAFREASQPIYDQYADRIGQDRIDEVNKIGEDY